MTNQEAFDQAARHLRAQVRRSRSGHKNRLRSPDGLKCAVGALIPDEDYRPSLEAAEFFELRALVPSLREVSTGLLVDLAAVHDAHDPYEWTIQLRRVAATWCLDTSALG